MKRLKTVNTDNFDIGWYQISYKLNDMTKDDTFETHMK